MSEPAPSVPSCANCGAALHGRFCAACGQEVRRLDPPLGVFLRDLGQELLDVDGRVFRSLRRLFLSPGFLTREYVEGRRAPWLSPLRLYLLTSVFYFAVAALAGSDGGMTLTVRGEAEAPDLSMFGFSSEAELQAAVDTTRATWMPRVMFVLVPVFAWFVSLARRSSGRGYPAHVQFALHLHAAWFGVRGLATASLLVLPAVAARGLELLGTAYGLMYLFVGLRVAYGVSRGRAARDLVLVLVPYAVSIVLATAWIVTLALFGRGGGWLQWLR